MEACLKPPAIEDRADERFLQCVVMPVHDRGMASSCLESLRLAASRKLETLWIRSGEQSRPSGGDSKRCL
jgi:hypothetical protein